MDRNKYFSGYNLKNTGRKQKFRYAKKNCNSDGKGGGKVKGLWPIEPPVWANLFLT